MKLTSAEDEKPWPKVNGNETNDPVGMTLGQEHFRVGPAGKAQP